MKRGQKAFVCAVSAVICAVCAASVSAFALEDDCEIIDDSLTENPIEMTDLTVTALSDGYETPELPADRDYTWSKDAYGRIYCSDASGEFLRGVCEVDGQKYIFSRNGAMKTGWRTIDGERVYFDGETGKVVKGVFDYDGRTFCTDDEGNKVEGMYTDENGDRYMFSECGSAVQNEFVNGESELCYAGDDGKFVCGSFEVDGKSYFADDNGVIQPNIPVNIEDKRIFANEYGDTGLELAHVSGECYCVNDNGEMCKGFQEVEGETRFFDEESGRMLKNWQNIDEKRYYFGDDGVMRKGVADVNGEKMRFDENGVYQPVKICLDAGHYSKYNNSPVNPDYWESDFNWDFHLMLKEELEKRGMVVITTREDKDVDLDVEERGRKSAGCDLFLSIHSNACDNSETDSPEAFCTINGKSDDIGLILAKTVAETMRTYQSGTIIHRDCELGDFYGMLRGAAEVGTPGIMMEHSFHTNLNAVNWLLDKNNLRKLAEAEAEAIYKFYIL